MNAHISEDCCRTLGGEEHEMAYSGGGRFGGMGGGWRDGNALESTAFAEVPERRKA